MVRVSGQKARKYVQKCEEFSNNPGTLYGRIEYFNDDCWYTVYSYGVHWPLFVCDMRDGKWYGNLDKFGTTTSKHQSQTHPLCEVQYISCKQIRSLANLGPRGFVDSEMRQAAGI